MRIITERRSVGHTHKVMLPIRGEMAVCSPNLPHLNEEIMNYLFNQQVLLDN